ncbi:tandem-type lipoprotein [Staphylococcus sp. Marseille-Q5304]|uniref:tandem-type lipoprotein n=1 Tax=Staphylococcus sp. Marseille-Q5304 TaxID=2942200 RepID=UPI0020746577|nr:tandem-type lipoprotein [Staphylococcus sp. Marseille-Q5304]
MKILKRLLLYVFVLFASILISGCGVLNIEKSSKERQIKKSFSKTLDMYPIKNLEDLYEKEGYRDDQFEKSDKGTWLLHSEMAIQLKGEDIETRGMVLKINRNTRTSKGHYITNTLSYDDKGRPQDNKKKYPVKMENNKIIPTRKVEDSNIRKEIRQFKFFAQYSNFKDFKDYKHGKISYNPNVPSYAAKYQLDNNDYNVKQLRKRYDIPTKQAPKLLLNGSGDLKGSSVGYKDIEYTFVENKKENIFFTDSIYFKPSENN